MTVIVANDFGEARDLEHGLITGSRMSERWTIRPDDPLSARAEIWWEQTLSRGDWSVRTEARSSMRSDADSFHLAARLEAWEGSDSVFERDFADTVARQHL